jgi:dynein heavy chain
MEKENNCQVIKLSHNKFLQIVENSIRLGLPVLLENILETLDPSL